MKAIKYLLMGALLAGFSTTANAQEEELQAALSAIKAKSGNVADAMSKRTLPRHVSLRCMLMWLQNTKAQMPLLY